MGLRVLRGTEDRRDPRAVSGLDDLAWAVAGGESIDEVAARADRVLERVRTVDGDVLIFSHGHLLRVLAARWLHREPRAGGMFALSTATISRLGWEREAP